MSISLADLQQQALSVAGLTDYLQLLLEGDERLQNIWVVGEVSSARNHPSGCFFSLADIIHQSSSSYCPPGVPSYNTQ